jgi:hypothetical protein
MLLTFLILVAIPLKPQLVQGLKLSNWETILKI